MNARLRKYHKALGMDFDRVLERIADIPTEIVLATKPFLKWVGGKRSILPELIARMPKEYTSYHEPFLGGGALFFATKPKEAYLSDINFHLIITYQAVRDDVETLIKYLKNHEKNHNYEYYQQARKKLFKEKDPTKIAGLLIYLNKTCFNGLYRVNSQGFFNVPMGDYKNPQVLDEETLRNDSELLQGITIKQHSFSQIKPKKKAFYYLDPPYHQTYEGYASGGFGDDEHRALATFCRLIDSTGGYFMLSNSDTPFVRELFNGYTIEIVSASRMVSCKAHQRGKENELIVRNY